MMADGVRKTLIVVTDQFESRQAVKIAKSGNNLVIIAVSLEAELYLKNNLKSWENPLYKLKTLNGVVSIEKYYFPNFRLAYNWYSDEIFEYIADRLGFWLSELDRSLDLASECLKRFEPNNLVIGKIIDYKGSSVQDGTLLPLAFYLAAKSKKLPYKFLQTKRMITNIRQLIGKTFQRVWQYRNSKIKGKYDVLVVAPPSKLALAKSFVENLANERISVCYLTYNLTLGYRKQINTFVDNYFEKEKLIDRKIRMEALKLKTKLINGRDWQKFVYPKYKKNLVVTNTIAEKIKGIVSEEIEDILIDLALAKKMLSDVRPKVLLTLTDPDTKCLTYINEAKKTGVKTMAIQHGADFDQIPYSMPASDHYLVWSDLAKRNMLAKLTTNSGKIFDRKKILIVQSPYHQFSTPRRKRRSLTKISLLFLATIHGFEKRINNYYLERLFIELFDSELEINLGVRTHPYQNLADFKALVKTYFPTARFENGDSLENVLNRYDLVIFENTTAALWALLAGKPTVFFNPYTGRDFFNFEKRGAAVSILKETEIEGKLTFFLKNKKLWQKYALGARKFAEQYLGLSRGQNRIVTVIRHLMNS